MPGLELPAQYQAIHHAAREGGRRERRKIMYNTNKVSPPSFIPNQFLVEEPNPEGLSVGRWEGGDALGRTLGTRCTPVSRDKAIICTAAPGHSPRCHPGCWQLHRSHSAPSRAGVPCPWSWGGHHRDSGAGDTQRRARGSLTSWCWEKMPSLCVQPACIFP